MQQGPGLAGPSGTGRPGRFNKACDSCHVSKVRCMPDPQSPVATCKRCSKNGTPCVFSPVGPRRRPARTKNDRIAELERRVRDMQLKLEKQVGKRAGAPPGGAGGGDGEGEGGGSGAVPGRVPEAGEQVGHAAETTHRESGSASPVGLAQSGPSSSARPGSLRSLPASPSGSPDLAPAAAPIKAAAAAAAAAAVAKESNAPTNGEISSRELGDPDLDDTTTTLPATTPASSTTPPRPYPPAAGGAPEPDVVERGLLTPSQADRLLQEFRASLDGRFMGICLPDGYTNARLRREKPAFWLSVLCAASAGRADFLHLAPMLFGEMKRILDAHLSRNKNSSNKNNNNNNNNNNNDAAAASASADDDDPAVDLDVLQAFMNYTTFYYDPVSPIGAELLGLWAAAIRTVVRMAETRAPFPNPPEEPTTTTTSAAAAADDDDDDPPAAPARPVTADDVQLARELLHWYWASFSLTVKNRRGTMLRQTRLVEAGVRVLRTTQSRHDMCLVEWVRLVRIAAEAVLALHRGHTQEAAGLSDEARDGILDEFERKRKQWLVDCPFDIVNAPLMLEYHYYVLLVSEVIYPAGPADFSNRSHGLPSLSLSPKTSTPLPDQNFFAPYKLHYTRKCITAAHACLDIATRPTDPGPPGAYYHADTCTTEDLLRRFGVIPYGRIFYALRFLMFVAHEIWRTGRYDVVEVEALRVEAHLTALKRCLRRASAGGTYRVSSLWLYAIETRIEPWYQKLSALLERDRPRAPEGQCESEEGGESTPRPVAVSPSREAAVSEPQSMASPPAEVNLSPLGPDFPYELFTASDVLIAPSSHDLSHFDWGVSTRAATSAPTSHGEGQSVTATSTSTQNYFQQAQAPIPEPSYQMSPLAGSGDAHYPTNHNNLNGNTGDLDAWFGNLNMDLDPSTLNWDCLGDGFPGSDMFLSSLAPYLPAESGQQRDPGGAMKDDGGQATQRGGQ